MHTQMKATLNWPSSWIRVWVAIRVDRRLDEERWLSHAQHFVRLLRMSGLLKVTVSLGADRQASLLITFYYSEMRILPCLACVVVFYYGELLHERKSRSGSSLATDLARLPNSSSHLFHLPTISVRSKLNRNDKHVHRDAHLRLPAVC